MDLKPLNPTADAPRYPADDKYTPGELIWGRYNWSGWSWLLDFLTQDCKWGADKMQHFAGSNDGQEIPAEVCVAVADELEKHMPRFDEETQQWQLPKVKLWRTCGGYSQL